MAGSTQVTVDNRMNQRISQLSRRPARRQKKIKSQAVKKTAFALLCFRQKFDSVQYNVDYCPRSMPVRYSAPINYSDPNLNIATVSMHSFIFHSV